MSDENMNEGEGSQENMAGGASVEGTAEGTEGSASDEGNAVVEKLKSCGSELLDDMKHGNIGVILGVVSVVLALIFLLGDFTALNIFNFILLLNIGLAGGLLHFGWQHYRAGDKPRVLILAAVAAVMIVLRLWQLSDAKASEFAVRAKIEKTRQDMQEQMESL